MYCVKNLASDVPSELVAIPTYTRKRYRAMWNIASNGSAGPRVKLAKVGLIPLYARQLMASNALYLQPPNFRSHSDTDGMNGLRYARGLCNKFVRPLRCIWCLINLCFAGVSEHYILVSERSLTQCTTRVFMATSLSDNGASGQGHV